jgi:hypothetical protein
LTKSAAESPPRLSSSGGAPDRRMILARPHRSRAVTARGASCKELGPFRPHRPPDGPESAPARSRVCPSPWLRRAQPRRCKGQPIVEGVNETQRIVGLDVSSPPPATIEAGHVRIRRCEPCPILGWHAPTAESAQPDFSHSLQRFRTTRKRQPIYGCLKYAFASATSGVSLSAWPSRKTSCS